MTARRDPRAERGARLVSGKGRPRFTLRPVAPPGQLRCDPRARRRAATIIDDLRPRIDWSASRDHASSRVAGREHLREVAAEAEIRIIADPAFLVLAVPDHAGGALSDHDRQLIAAARGMADEGGGAVVVLTVGEIDGLAAAGADRVVTLPAGSIGEYDPEGRAAAVAAVMESLSPRHVLFAESADGGADLARRVAAASGERLFAGLEGIADGRASRRMAGGARELLGAPPHLISIAEHAFAAHDGPPHEARMLEPPDFSADRRIESAVPLPVDADQLPLSETDFILSAGNGVTDWESFAELASVLGATRAGSRVVCDEGYLPRDRQVGASGSLVTARCYLAFGISGAPQHLQGITEVGHVVAINTDLHAEMIKRADLAIIADAQEVMPALIRYARERRNG
jgi:electron transfer flavoprotein alpha subunit